MLLGLSKFLGLSMLLVVRWRRSSLVHWPLLQAERSDAPQLHSPLAKFTEGTLSPFHPFTLRRT